MKRSLQFPGKSIPDIMHGLHMLYTPAKWPDIPTPDRDVWKLTRIHLSGYSRECLETLSKRYSNQHICTAALLILKNSRERGMAPGHVWTTAWMQEES